MSAERIYSVGQLAEALQSGLLGLKEQLQVLSILDGSASSWPGLGAAVEDLECLIKLSAKRTLTLDAEQQQLQQANARLEGQLTGLHHSTAAAHSKAQAAEDEFKREQQRGRQLQRNLDAAQADADSTKRQVWELERIHAQLTAAVEKAHANGGFMEGELAGAREQLEEQRQQVYDLREQLAASRNELSYTSNSLQERKQQLDDVRAQLAALQQQSSSQLDATQKLLLKATDNAALQLRQVQEHLECQIKQLQAELAEARTDKQQLEKARAQQQQEVSTLAAALHGSQADVTRLREFQDVVKRVADDRVAEVNTAMTALQQQAKQQRQTTEAEVMVLQGKLHQRETESSGLQRQLGLMQVQLREAQRAQAAAAEAQAAAGVAHKSQQAELTALQQKLKDAERVKADHALSQWSLRESCAAEVAGLRQQLEDARREAAVARAKADAWQRDNKVDLATVLHHSTARRLLDYQALQEQLQQLEAAAAASNSAAESARASAVQERLALHAAAAAQELVLRELKVQLEGQQQEVRHARLEAASLTKRYEQALQRLRREADAGAEEVRRLHQMHAAAAAAAATVSAAAAAAATSHRAAALLGLQEQQQQQQGPEATASVNGGHLITCPAGCSSGAASCTVPGVGEAANIPPQLQREIDKLRSYMRTVSRNLQAADAAMQVAAAACSMQSSPQLVGVPAALPTAAGQLAGTLQREYVPSAAECPAVKSVVAAQADSGHGLQQQPATFPNSTSGRFAVTGKQGPAVNKGQKTVVAATSSSIQTAPDGFTPHEEVSAMASGAEQAVKPPVGAEISIQVLGGAGAMLQDARGQPALSTSTAVASTHKTPRTTVALSATRTAQRTAVPSVAQSNAGQKLTTVGTAVENEAARVGGGPRRVPTINLQPTNQQPSQQPYNAACSPEPTVLSSKRQSDTSAAAPAAAAASGSRKAKAKAVASKKLTA